MDKEQVFCISAIKDKDFSEELLAIGSWVEFSLPFPSDSALFILFCLTAKWSPKKYSEKNTTAIIPYHQNHCQKGADFHWKQHCASKHLWANHTTESSCIPTVSIFISQSAVKLGQNAVQVHPTEEMTPIPWPQCPTTTDNTQQLLASFVRSKPGQAHWLVILTKNSSSLKCLKWFGQKRNKTKDKPLWEHSLGGGQAFVSQVV